MTFSKRVLAIIVLYKRHAEQSNAYIELKKLLLQDENRALSIELLLCDNTPTVQQPPEGFAGSYLSDTSNPGLAKHYNTALQIAEEKGIPWIMLFDQDTSPTEEYLQELFSVLNPITADPSIVAIVPKLHNGRKIQSPYTLPTLTHHTVSAEQWGRSETILHGFNSGTIIRTSSMRAAGGFCEEFALDYLDYVTFSEIQKHGEQVYVMKSMLRHELAASNIRSSMPLDRYRTIVSAEKVFYERYGTGKDRFYRRMRMLKTTVRHLLKDRKLSFALLTLRAAFR